MNTLKDCPTSIGSSCVSNTTFPTECNTTVNTYYDEYKGCAQINDDTKFCGCIDTLDFDSVKGCQKAVKEAETNTTTARKACLVPVAACKKASLEVAAVVDYCCESFVPPSSTTTPTTSTTITTMTMTTTPAPPSCNKGK